MILLRSLVFDVFLYGLMLVLGILFAPLALWSADGAQLAIKVYTRSVLWLLAVICGLRVEVRGPVPGGNVIVCSKHQSFLDILVLSRELPRVSFVMKKELRWAPILGLYALRIGSTPVARGRRGAAMKEMVARVESQAAPAAEGSSGPPRQLVIYPQGTRVAPGATLPYKIGAGVLYQRLGQTCVPAATNVGVFWGRRSLRRHPGLAVIEFLEPIPPGLPLPDFMARLEEEIETASNRLMREAGFDPAAGPVADP